jgi:membrane protease YdiL (CAAX protease family)
MDNPQTPRSAWNPLAAFGLALGVYVAAFLAATVLPEPVTTRYPWARQAVTQGLMAVVALGAMAASRRPWAEFGFRRPAPARGPFILWGLVLGAATTGVILALGLRGMRERLAAYGLPGIVLWIWVISSIVEELFCRGWFQTLAEGGESDSHGERARAAIPWSAALFGAMHLPLLFGAAEIAASVVIVLSVTALGYVCATARPDGQPPSCHRRPRDVQRRRVPRGRDLHDRLPRGDRSHTARMRCAARGRGQSVHPPVGEPRPSTFM